MLSLSLERSRRRRDRRWERDGNLLGPNIVRGECGLLSLSLDWSRSGGRHTDWNLLGANIIRSLDLELKNLMNLLSSALHLY